MHLMDRFMSAHWRECGKQAGAERERHTRTHTQTERCIHAHAQIKPAIQRLWMTDARRHTHADTRTRTNTHARTQRRHRGRATEVPTYTSTVLLFGELDRKLGNTFRCPAGNHFHAVHRVFVGPRFHTRVHVFSVFTDAHHVNVLPGCVSFRLIRDTKRR